MSNDKYIGLDVHQSNTVAAVHNHLGKCIMESIIETKTETILLSSPLNALGYR